METEQRENSGASEEAQPRLEHAELALDRGKH